MGKRREVAVRVRLMSLLASIAVYLCPIPNTFAAPLERLDPTVTLLGGTPNASAEGPAEPDLSVMPVSEYIDQYLTEGDESDEWYRNAPRHDGRRSVGTELVYYQDSSNVFGDATEMGLWTRGSMETRNFGNLDAEFILSNQNIDYIGRQRNNSDVMFTLRQTGAPIADHWTMNNTVGYQRTLVSSMMNSGYRVRLPTSPLLGFSGELINSNKEFMWFTGKTGYYEGNVLRQFEEDGGKLTGGAFQQEVVPEFWIGGEAVTFSGNDLVRDHSSVLAAGEYAPSDLSMRYDMHVLADDDSNFGVWADGMNYLPANLQLRYGAFYLQPELAWMDRPIANDQTGLYVRTDKLAFMYTLSAGYDYVETGIGGDSFFPSNRLHSTFFNGNYRVNRRLTLGLNTSVGFRQVASAENEDQILWRFNNFLYYQFPIGTSRLELYVSDLSSDISTSDESKQGMLVSHDWRMPQGLRLTTEARLEETQRTRQDRSYQEASVRFRQDVADKWAWGVNTTVYRDSGERFSYDGIGVTADARWNFLPNWYASLNVLYNANAIDTGNIQQANFEDNPKSNSVWLTIGYGKTTGRPLTSLGHNAGAVGSGRITGFVFYDENQDFIRQPGEKPAVNVVVLLDGRYEVMTDNEGRYTFDPVYTGVHRVSLIIENLPLPWTMHDETPRRVEVNLRRSGEVNFPLVRIN